MMGRKNPKRIGQVLRLLALSLMLIFAGSALEFLTEEPRLAGQAVAQQDCSGDITLRVLKILQNIDGTTGLYLKQVGGLVLAACHERTAFEPASTIKVLHHLHAMLQVQNGSVVQGSVVTLETSIPWFQNYVKNRDGSDSSCPADTGPTVSALRDVLMGMMQRSDNRDTQAIRVYFGQENINATAQIVGMKDTALNNQRMGCALGPEGAVDNPNRLTLYDAGLLYEKVADSTLLKPPNRQAFYSLMAGKEFDFTGIWGDIQRMVNEEAPPTMTAEQKNSFLNQTDTRYKAGSYTFCLPNCLYYTSMAGWAQIPFCGEGKVVARQYVFGIFFDSATRNPSTAFRIARSELLREQLHAALQAFGACSTA